MKNKKISYYHIVGSEETYSCRELENEVNKILDDEENKEKDMELLGTPFLEKGETGEVGWNQVVVFYE